MKKEKVNIGISDLVLIGMGVGKGALSHFCIEKVKFLFQDFLLRSMQVTKILTFSWILVTRILEICSHFFFN